MGTNFYLKPKGPESFVGHIGCRAAAGLYCWDCNVTLCKGGKERIHLGPEQEQPRQILYTFPNRSKAEINYWYSKCPNCGKKPKDENLSASSSGRELGFNKNPPERKQGVATCSSFTWAMGPEEVEQRMNKSQYAPIVDEYDREYTLQEFQDVLIECPVRYYHLIGQEFS